VQERLRNRLCQNEGCQTRTAQKETLTRRHRRELILKFKRQ
jgi:hypothetical protein